MFRLAEFKFHPITVSVPLSDGLKWRGGGDWCYQEKVDGVRAALVDGVCFGRSRAIPFQVPASLNSSRLDGELAGGVFHAFDVPVFNGQDISREPLRLRKQVLREIILKLNDPRFTTVAEGIGGEFLEAILSRGGEGIVAKHLDSRYGEFESWVKCKRMETHDCVVTEIHASKQSVQLNGNGWCAVLGHQFGAIRAGDVVEIACHSITASGKFREPRFIRRRADKLPV